MKIIHVLIVLLISLKLSAQKAEIFQKDGAAIRGYDPVAFFTESKPIKGDEQYFYEWKEARWLFSSRFNLDLFKQSPEKYAPQYGGYCAYGMADGHKAPTETETWIIINNKLYFNYNKKVKEYWSKDTRGMIEKADSNWLMLKNVE